MVEGEPMNRTNTGFQQQRKETLERIKTLIESNKGEFNYGDLLRLVLLDGFKPSKARELIETTIQIYGYELVEGKIKHGHMYNLMNGMND